MIEIKNLRKVYKVGDREVLALDDVSLNVRKGEIFGIIGLSGAGKSTLIRCINMLEKPTSGTIIIDGNEITSLDKRKLRLFRQKIGMIFQQFNLLSSRTVFDNVMFPLQIARVPRGEAEKRVHELLELVGLTDKASMYPAQLSGGQKQRVGIARALANGPSILLSDESTSALDPQTTSSILKLLKDINRQFNLTILLITHDMNVIKEICDRVAVIHNARVIESGAVLDIFSNPKTAISRSFVNAVLTREIPEELLQNTSEQSGEIETRLIRMSFIGTSAGKPLISSMIRRYNIDVNILYGNIDRIKDTPFGSLTIEVIGRPELLEEALHYLHGQGVEIEVRRIA